VLRSCDVETYPNVPNPTIVEVKFVPVIVPPELIYPMVPRPLTVDCKVESKTGDEIRVVVPADKYPAVPRPRTVD
jgi:hypothetical protein